ncbi:uncharacterized protein LOC133291936 [Gastrolobium bilobum]|uniref:uncharacterized protein LOC133291936 n=1 Tax=Gastrolobium bilobum TaxID=150636 RepID=UPI002AB0143A|nr:uncharacterized protein LOC133291936 [Gastrolobium bilobum]
MRTSREQDHTIRFLRGLNEQFAQARSQIMMMEPMPNVVKAFSFVIQQERQFSSEDNHNLPQAQAVVNDQIFRRTYHDNSRRGRTFRGRGEGRSYAGSYGGRNFSKLCTHCHRTNHTIETCYLLHDFPPGYRKNMANNVSTHSEAPFNPQAPPNINMIQDQYQQILSLLQKPTPPDAAAHNANAVLVSNSIADNMQPGIGIIEWIIDTACIFGTIHISPTLTINNVLYKTSNYQTLIGSAEQRGGLYVVESKDVTAHTRSLDVSRLNVTSSCIPFCSNISQLTNKASNASVM